jgi:trigger factor
MELIQNKEGLVATLTVKIPREDYAAKVEKELKKIRQTAQIRGFRPGNAPMHLIKKMYEQPILFDEVNKILFEAVKNYEKENNEYLIGQLIPADDNQQYADLNTTKDLEFTYEAGFFPEFNYQINESIELPYYEIVPSDLEIEAKMEELLSLYFFMEPAEIVDEESIIRVNIKYMKEDEEKNLTSSFAISYMPDECRSLFLGAKEGDTVNVEKQIIASSALDLLETGYKEFEALPEIIPFTIFHILKKVPAKLEQPFFDYLVGTDKIHSKEEFKEFVKNNLISEYEDLSLDKLYVDSIKIIPKKLDISLPEDFITKYVRCVQKENEETEELMGKKLQFAVQYFSENAKWSYIIDSVLRKDNFTVTTQMVREEARKIIEKQMRSHQFFNMDELIDQYLSTEKEFHDVINKIKYKQFTKILKKNAKLNISNISFSEFYDRFAVKDTTEYDQKTEYTAFEESATENSVEYSPETEEIVENEITTEESATVPPATENPEEYNPKESAI